MKYPHALLGLLLAVRAVTAASAPLPDLLPPNARVMFGIQLRNLVSSSLVQGMTDDLRTASSEWMKLIPLIGFDPFHDIDEVLVASTGDGQKAPMLLVASGRFGAARFSGGKPYHGVSVVDGGKGSNGVMALLDASTVIMGDEASVRAAIDRRGSAAHLDAAFAAQVESLRGRYDVWGLGNRPQGFVPPAAAPASDQFQSVDRFQFGVMLAHGLEITAQLHARSPKDVEKLTSSVQLIQAMVNAQQPSSTAAKFDVRAENGSLRISLSVPEEEIKKAIETHRAALKPAHPAAPKLPPPGVQTTDGGTVIVTLPGSRN
jgi:hypothetical protein